MTLSFLFVSAIALQDVRGRVLLSQRPEGKDMAGLWEFPGGKVGDGETPEEALVREIKEELNLSLLSKDLLPLTFASHVYDQFRLFMPLFLCRIWSGTPQPMEKQKIAWVAPRDLSSYPMPPADLPLAKRLERLIEID